MDSYELIVVGTGFASTFFLLKYLKKRPDARVLVLERGYYETHAWKLQNRHLMDVTGVTSQIPFRDTYRNLTPDKPWVFTPSFGGSSNCWYGCTPRFLPSDFQLLSRYGVAVDWPIDYDQLEPYYVEAETVMAVAGPSDHTPFRRSAPYPQPPHRMNEVDNILTKAYPDSYYIMPAARPTRGTEKRGRCCGSGVCNLCPVDAKFTILNELADLYRLPNVTLTTEAQVVALRIEAGSCRGVFYRLAGEEREARADLVALGANPIFNAHILLNSGIEHRWLGRGLSEQLAFSCTIDLAGIDNYSGSTIATGHGYMLYDGEHRKKYSACLIENHNLPRLRIEPGKYRQRAFMKFVFEDIPALENTVQTTERRELPAVEFRRPSRYLTDGIEKTKRALDKVLSPLPIERMKVHDVHPTEGHILGTARMGSSVEQAVVDDAQRLFQVRNVLSLGGSSFPTNSPANPTLTIAALSLRSAERLLQ